MPDEPNQRLPESVQGVLALQPSEPVLSPKDEAESEGNWRKFLSHADQPHNPSLMVASPTPPPSILSYFGLPPLTPSGEVRGLFEDLATALNDETRDADEFFLILKAIERRSPRLDDPVARLRRVVQEIKAMAEHGSVKEQLALSGELNFDDIEQEAIASGNWGKYLGTVERLERQVRG